jgi:hypothetical protein
MPLKFWVWIPFRQGILDTTLCDKACQWLATGQWFSLDTPVSPTNKTDYHDITEILVKVALNTIKTFYTWCLHYNRDHDPTNDRRDWHNFSVFIKYIWNTITHFFILSEAISLPTSKPYLIENYIVRIIFLTTNSCYKWLYIIFDFKIVQNNKGLCNYNIIILYTLLNFIYDILRMPLQFINSYYRYYCLKQILVTL